MRRFGHARLGYPTPRFETPSVPTPIAVDSVEVAPSTLSLLVDGTGTLTATPKDADGNSLLDRVVSWSSSDDAVVSVAAVGRVAMLTAGVAGNATISASCEGKTGTAAVAVSAAPTGSGIVHMVSVHPTALQSAESAIKSKLEAAGFTVRTGSATHSSNLAGDEDVIFFGWTGAGSWMNSYAGLGVPVLALQNGAASFLKMGTQSTTDGLPDTTELEIAPLPHPALSRPAGVYTATRSKQTPIIYHDLSPHATTLGYDPSSRWYPRIVVHERGEPMGPTDFPAPARRALCYEVPPSSINDSTPAGIDVLVDLILWLSQDPGLGPVPLLDLAVSHAGPDDTDFTLTDASLTDGTHALSATTIRHYEGDGTLLQAYTPGVGGSLSLANQPDGFRYAKVEVTDTAGVTRARLYPLYGEVYAPRAKLSTTVTDGSPASNVVHFDASATQERGVPIESYEFRLWNDLAMTSLAWSSGPQASATLDSAGMADGTYYRQVVVENTDGVADQTTPTAADRIVLPRPPSNHFAEVHGVGQYAYGYYYGTPAPGCTFTSVTFDVDPIDNPGAYTGTGVHPKILTPYTSGDRPFKVTVVQSNGWTDTIELAAQYMTGFPAQSPAKNRWRAYQPRTWAEAQNYDRPVATSTGKTIYCNAETGSDVLAGGAPNPGTDSATPLQTHARINELLAPGDVVNVAADFSAQGSWKLSSINPGADPSKHTVVQQWAGQAQAVFQKDDGTPSSTIWLSNCNYVWILGLEEHGESPDGKRGKGVLVQGGSHNTVADCNLTFGNAGVYFDGSDFGWADNNDIDFIGTNVEIEPGNGGNGLVIYAGSNDCTLVRNRIRHCGHNGIDGIRFKDAPDSFRCRIAHNEVNNPWAGSIGVAGLNDSLVEWNDFHDLGLVESVSTVGSKDGINQRGDYVIVRHNRSWDANNHPFQQQTNTAVGRIHSRRCHSYHNTYFRSGGPLQLAEQDWTEGSVPWMVGSFLEDNLHENNLALECEGLNYPKPGPVWFQWYVNLFTCQPWAIREFFHLEGKNDVPAADLGGNTVRHCLNWNSAAGRTNKMLLIGRGVGNLGFDTWADVEDAFTAWTGNVEADPLVLSTTEGEAGFLTIDETSPAYNAGLAVAGITYPGGIVNIGWDPNLDPNA